VDIGENVDRRQFIDKLSEFSARLQSGDIAFFFYSGPWRVVQRRELHAASRHFSAKNRRSRRGEKADRSPLIAGPPEGPLKERAKARAKALKKTRVANLTLHPSLRPPPAPSGVISCRKAHC
jgi:hypothetical protein